MSFENLVTFVRSMKGAPASVLLSLIFSRKSLTNRELQRWTGYSDDTITQATRLLVDLGWITASGPHGPWCLAAAPQLPLLDRADKQLPGLRASPVLVRAETLNSTDEQVARNLRALYDAGVREPIATRLARLPHVNPEYVAAHVDHALAEGGTLGTAIYRIQHAWPLPPHRRERSVEEQIRRFLRKDI